MARNMQKKIDEYERKFYDRTKNKGGKGAFYQGDYNQLADIAEQRGCTKYDYIDAALKAGFMLGYEQAKRDAKNLPAKK